MSQPADVNTQSSVGMFYLYDVYVALVYMCVCARLLSISGLYVSLPVLMLAFCTGKSIFVATMEDTSKVKCLNINFQNLHFTLHALESLNYRCKMYGFNTKLCYMRNNKIIKIN